MEDADPVRFRVLLFFNRTSQLALLLHEARSSLVDGAPAGRQCIWPTGQVVVYTTSWCQSRCNAREWRASV